MVNPSIDNLHWLLQFYTKGKKLQQDVEKIIEDVKIFQISLRITFILISQTSSIFFLSVLFFNAIILIVVLNSKHWQVFRHILL